MRKVVGIAPELETHASSWWRIQQPMRALANAGYDAVTTTASEVYNGQVNVDDAIVIIHRLIPGDPSEYMKNLREAGTKIVLYSMDDFTINGPVLEQYLRESGGLTNTQVQSIISRIPTQLEFINMCDGVLVSTSKLGYMVEDEVRRSMPIKAIQNAIPLDFYLEALDPESEHINNGKKIFVGYASGRRPESDLLPMCEAWRYVASKYDNVYFVVAGYQHDIIDRHIPADRKIRIPWRTLDEWPKSMQVDIGCCPMARIPFNEGKSHVKYLEYSMAGAAVIASSFYADAIVNRVTGLIANTTEMWIEALECYISRRYYRLDIQDNAEYNIRNYHSMYAVLPEWIYYLEGLE